MLPDSFLRASHRLVTVLAFEKHGSVLACRVPGRLKSGVLPAGSPLVPTVELTEREWNRNIKLWWIYTGGLPRHDLNVTFWW